MVTTESLPNKEPESRAPKLLLFDLGGVVLAFDEANTHRYLVDELGVAEEHAVKFFTGDYDEFNRGRLTEDQFYDSLRSTLQAPQLTNEQLLTAHDQHIYGLVPGMVELMDQLSQQYPIVLVTDTNPWQNALQERMVDLSMYPRVSSHEMGMQKADSENPELPEGQQTFFTHVLHENGVLPHEALLIDDSLTKFRAAGRDGIHAILFNGRTEDLHDELVQRRILPK